MIDREQEKSTAEVKALLGEAEQVENLPYRVELWTGSSSQVERILARATNAQLASAIFKEAVNEYPGRRVTVSDGPKIVLDSGQP
jgi:hypothetical protein